MNKLLRSVMFVVTGSNVENIINTDCDYVTFRDQKYDLPEDPLRKNIDMNKIYGDLVLKEL